MKKLNLIFGAFPKELENEIEGDSINSVQYAANSLQWKFIDGFRENNISCKNYNAMYIDSYPFGYKKLCIKRETFSYENVEFVNIGFNNLLYWSIISKYLKLKKELKKSKDDELYLFYSLTFSFVLISRYLKRKHNAKCIFVVTDLPEHMNTAAKISLRYKILKGLEIFVINKCKKYIDGYVYLSKHMAETNDRGKPYIVVEGIAGEKSTNVNRSEKIIRIGYAGTVNVKYGIKELVDSLLLLDDNYVLEICGTGDFQERLEELSQNSERINYYGRLKREDVEKMLEKCDILVNPRDDSEIFTKYSFPSKNLEYLATMKPVVVYKLLGIPDEYDEFFFYANGCGVAKAIKKAVQGTKDYKEMSERLSNFLEEKGRKRQTMKIINFCDKIEVSNTK